MLLRNYGSFGTGQVFSWADGTQVAAVRDTEDYSDGKQKWIANEGYDIRIASLSEVPNQNQGCTIQLKKYFGYLWELIL